MTYRSLLVLLDQDPRCAERIELAVALARGFDAHLVGLAPTGRLQFPVFVEGGVLGGELIDRAWALLREQADHAAARFRQICRRAGLASIETLVVEEDTAQALVRHAHCSDLCLLGQPDPSRPQHLLERDTLEQVLLHSARPTLVVPYAGAFAGAGRRVMVAWDDSREATRAVSDALPLLQRAQRVDLVAWCETGDAEAAMRPRLGALQRWLRWHGVSAEPTVECTEIPIAESMLSRAADGDADLLVMGAWGHTRFNERLFGGATRGLLASMTLPVLMSH